MIGDLLAERYEMLELIGSGGMSSVYKAHDRLLERNVALKVLHPHYSEDDEYVERFRREARSVARLSHPNIVTVIDRGEADGHQFIVFELIDGENLKELIQRTGALPVRRAVELGIAIADALAFAHDHDLVHRDVKPQNVLLNGDGEAKVTDFGIARSLDVERGVTQTGTVLGTSAYLSPEQASGKTVTTATDVYSLGIVLYELLTGDVPFPGDNFVAVAMKHINEPPPDLLERRPDVPIRLAATIERALAKDPDERFGSMTELSSALRQTLAELADPDADRTFVAPSPVPRDRGLRRGAPHRRRTATRRRWPLYGLLVLLAAAAIAAGALGLGGSKGHKAPSQTAAAVVPVRAVASYDPQGNDRVENNDSVPAATDGNPSTFWTTDIYTNQSFGNLKSGVGVVVDAGRSVPLKQLTVTTDTPGFTAKILAGSSPSGPFHDDSGVRTVNGSGTFALNGAPARYYVVWLTGLPPGNVAHVNEIKARA
jgi:serine/threonine-protein kinase